MSDTTKVGKSKHFRSESQWRQIIAEYESSGLTQDQFCQHAAIAKSSFYHWRKRLENSEPKGETTQFIDLTDLMHREGTRRWEIELDLGDGIRLSLRGR
jgi:hypothetical protein